MPSHKDCYSGKPGTSASCLVVLQLTNLSPCQPYALFFANTADIPPLLVLRGTELEVIPRSNLFSERRKGFVRERERALQPGSLHTALMSLLQFFSVLLLTKKATSLKEKKKEKGLLEVVGDNSLHTNSTAQAPSSYDLTHSSSVRLPLHFFLLLSPPMTESERVAKEEKVLLKDQLNTRTFIPKRQACSVLYATCQ